MLPVSPRFKPYAGGALHLLPPLIIAAWLVSFRRSEMTCSAAEMATLLLAVAWCFVGPALIWCYERRTIPSLAAKIRERVRSPDNSYVTGAVLYRNVLSSPTALIFTIIWAIGISVPYLSSIEFVRKFAIRGYDDPLFWVLLAGILYLAVYTAIGIIFACRAIFWVRDIAKLHGEGSIYNSDGVLGFSYLGRFVRDTSMMLLSGWLMVPVLFQVVAPSLGFYIWLWVGIIAAYVTVCVVLFGVPVLILRHRIVHLKCEIIDRFGRLSSETLERLVAKYDPRLAVRYEVYRGAFADARAVRNWPLGIDEFVKFGLSVLIFPVIISYLVVQ